MIICRKPCALHLLVEMHRCKHRVLFLTLDRINQVYSTENNDYSCYTTQSAFWSVVIDKKLQNNILYLEQKLKFLKIYSSAGFSFFLWFHLKSLGCVHWSTSSGWLKILLHSLLSSLPLTLLKAKLSAHSSATLFHSSHTKGPLWVV